MLPKEEILGKLKIYSQSIQLDINRLINKFRLNMLAESFTKRKELKFKIIYSDKPVFDKAELNFEERKLTEIDATLLATSLSGMCKSLKAANTDLNGEYVQTSITIKGSFETGSFIVNVLTTLQGSPVSGIIDIMALVGFPGAAYGTYQAGELVYNSLIKLIKDSKGEKIKSRAGIAAEPVTLVFENNPHPFIVNRDVAKLYENTTIKEGLSEFVTPLNDPLIMNIAIVSEGYDPEIISKADEPSFKSPETEILGEFEDEGTFFVTRADFSGTGKGWRFGDLDAEDTSFAVTILDNKFLENAKKLNFHQGTRIKVRFKRIVKKMAKAREEWQVLNVISLDETDFNTPKKYQDQLIK